jgi:hypothetical protein
MYFHFHFCGVQPGQCRRLVSKLDCVLYQVAVMRVDEMHRGNRAAKLSVEMVAVLPFEMTLHL